MLKVCKYEKHRFYSLSSHRKCALFLKHLSVTMSLKEEHTRAKVSSAASPSWRTHGAVKQCTAHHASCHLRWVCFLKNAEVYLKEQYRKNKQSAIKNCSRFFFIVNCSRILFLKWGYNTNLPVIFIYIFIYLFITLMETHSLHSNHKSYVSLHSKGVWRKKNLILPAT